MTGVKMSTCCRILHVCFEHFRGQARKIFKSVLEHWIASDFHGDGVFNWSKNRSVRANTGTEYLADLFSRSSSTNVLKYKYLSWNGVANGMSRNICGYFCFCRNPRAIGLDAVNCACCTKKLSSCFNMDTCLGVSSQTLSSQNLRRWCRS